MAMREVKSLDFCALLREFLKAKVGDGRTFGKVNVLEANIVAEGGKTLK